MFVLWMLDHLETATTGVQGAGFLCLRHWKGEGP